MHAYLIIGKGDRVESEIEKLIKSKSAKRIDYSLSKIDEVRSLAGFTKLKISEPTAIVIKDIDNSSLDALNAFLKKLEEAQTNLYYILTASSIYKVIPTIISRCQLINIKDNYSLNADTTKTVHKFINSNLSYKLTQINQMKDRKLAIEFMENLIFSVHKMFVSGPDRKRYRNILHSGTQCLKALYANGNINLQVSIFAIKI